MKILQFVGNTEPEDYDPYGYDAVKQALYMHPGQWALTDFKGITAIALHNSIEKSIDENFPSTHFSSRITNQGLHLRYTP